MCAHKKEGQSWWPPRSRKKKCPTKLSLRSCPVLKHSSLRKCSTLFCLEANEQVLVPRDTTVPHTNRLHGGIISLENGMANTLLAFYVTYRPTAVFTHANRQSLSERNKNRPISSDINGRPTEGGPLQLDLDKGLINSPFARNFHVTKYGKY